MLAKRYSGRISREGVLAFKRWALGDVARKVDGEEKDRLGTTLGGLWPEKSSRYFLRMVKWSGAADAPR